MSDLTDEQMNAVTEAIREGSYMRSAAEAIGVPEHVVYECLARGGGDPERIGDPADVPGLEQIEALCAAIRLGRTELEAANEAGVERGRFYRWMAASGPGGLAACQTLAREIGRAMEQIESEMLSRVEEAAARGEREAEQWLAERAQGVARVAAWRARKPRPS